MYPDNTHLGLEANCLVKRALLCFDENTQVLIQDRYWLLATGSKIPIHQLTFRDMILSVIENHIFYDEVTISSPVEETFAAINFVEHLVTLS